MFCPKCGNQLPDDAKFCGACGMNMAELENEAQPVQENAAYQKDAAEQYQEGSSQQGDASYNYGYGNTPQPDMNGGGSGNPGGFQQAPTMEEGSKKLGLIVGIGVIIVAVLVVVLLAKLLFGGGYKKPLDNIVDLVNDRETDIDAYAEALLPGFVFDAYEDIIDLAKDEDADLIEDAYDEAEKQIEDAWEEIEEQAEDFEISYEIEDKKSIDSDDLEDIQKAYVSIAKMIPLDELEDVVDAADDDSADELFEIVEDLVNDMKDMDVSAGYKVKIRLTIEADDDDISQKLTLYMIKVDGDWMVDYLSTLAKYSGTSVSDIVDELESELNYMDLSDITDLLEDLQDGF